MAQAPRFKGISKEFFPGAPAWTEPFFLMLNETVGQLVYALQGRLTLGENVRAGQLLDIKFVTPASGNEAVKVKVDFTPAHFMVTHIERVDGAALTASWSYTTKPIPSNDGSNPRMAIYFQGLPASTKFKAKAVYF